jgi:hypothetical protein
MPIRSVFIHISYIKDDLPEKDPLPFKSSPAMHIAIKNKGERKTQSMQRWYGQRDDDIDYSGTDGSFPESSGKPFLICGSR